MGWEISPCQLWMVKPDRKYKSNRRATSKLTLINSWYLVRPLHIFLLNVFCGLLIVHGGNWAEDLWHLLPPPVPLMQSRSSSQIHTIINLWPSGKISQILTWNADVTAPPSRSTSSSTREPEKGYFVSFNLIFSTARSSDRVRIARAPPRGSSSVSWVLADLACSPAPCRCPHRTEKQHFDSLDLLVLASSHYLVL